MPEEQATESKNFINIGVVLNGNGEVLIIRRAKEEIGKEGRILKWAFPGGKQHLGESRVQCVEREVLDETGYKITQIKEISLRLPPDLPIIIVYHLCRLSEPQPAKEPQQPWEIAEVKWVKPEELKTLFTTSLDPQVAKELKIA